MIKKDWAFLGFNFGSRIALAYITTKSDPINEPTGIGTYFLEEDIGIYKGKWRGLDSTHHAIIECPYVLIKSAISDEQAKKEYDILQKPCIEVTNK